jgi:hypothetical protein
MSREKAFMTINIPSELETALNMEASRLGTRPEKIVEQALRDRLSTLQPASSSKAVDARLRRLLSVARQCGTSISNEDLSREKLYD